MGYPKYEDLKSLSDDKLIERHNNLSKHKNESPYLDELRWRKQERHTRSIRRLTIWITIMTAIMTVSTIINVLLFLNK